jgi:hypothetical protein
VAICDVNQTQLDKQGAALAASRAWPRPVPGLSGPDHGAGPPDHAGLKSLETTDELYTCLLTSGSPVDVLATATSIVDQKEFPMALIHQYGQGRVFLYVLGHDIKALSVEAVQDLYRRGTAWAAELP